MSKLEQLKNQMGEEDFNQLMAEAILNAPENIIRARLDAIEEPKKRDREAYKQMVAEAVPHYVDRLVTLSEHISREKTAVFQGFEDIITLKNEVYDVEMDAAEQQTHTFSYEKCRLVLGYRIVAGWDDTVWAGVHKLRAHIEGMGVDANSRRLATAVEKLLLPDKNGQLRRNAILDMQKMQDDFNSPEFADGIKTILDAWNPSQTCWFIEAYQKDKEGKWRGVALSIAKAGFADGYVFGGF